MNEHGTLEATRTFVERRLLGEFASEDAISDEAVREMKSLGLFGTLIARDHGGLGLDLITHGRIIEELARGWVSAAGILNPHVLCCTLVSTAGTEAQKAALLPRLATGELRGAFALSEPHAGSDVQAITTRAEAQPDGGYRLNGRKRWITNGLAANVVFTLARSDPDARPAHRGMTCFIVEKEPFARVGSSPYAGVDIPEIIDKMGDRGVETTDMVLTDYHCPSERVLGEGAGVGQGFTQMLAAMETGRIGASSICLGVARRCMEVAVDYALDRETFGQPIADHQAIQFKLADMAVKIEASRCLIEAAAAARMRGERSDRAAGIAKLYASDAAVEIAEEAFRIHGSNGYSKGSEIERLYRDALSLVSAEGPSEIQRLIIGRGIVSEARRRKNG
ncbi:acyl-CoA dehydrogenase family protein [Mesobacterium pallidum]|uniref:acyl-CoA dehydrogenase family protein n=1 Tax=Mesobacterium pallidum TaxID=2872037 RepID=UPI001EE389EE|nr:acyl-CoA dehydrogenase family protein [Mesobacterium pallidum]